MYLLPRMKLTFPQQIMGFAAWRNIPLSPLIWCPLASCSLVYKIYIKMEFLIGRDFHHLRLEKPTQAMYRLYSLASRGGLDICAKNYLLKIDCLIFAFDKFWKRNKQPESRRGSSLSYIGNVVAGGTKNPSHPSHCCIILINLFWSLWLK